MPKIEIDGISVDAQAGSTIIEVADRLQIPIPRFCYHHKLSVAANCRMCLVQVEKSPKALPACATPVTDGMKIWTKSNETKAAQSAVMEYLLINHPLDCPICDQGGECELQDVSMQYGQGKSRFDEPKRAVLDENLGSLIETEMTRCIQCTRCVRFGSEVSGERELGAVGRSDHMEISTFIQHTMDSEISGNIIDLCPVGALTSKPFRFKARAWELAATSGISPHDCIGSNLYWHTLRHKIMRVAPKDTEVLNEVWLSDRDRFSYEGLTHSERLRKATIFKQRWNDVEWPEALRHIMDSLQRILKDHGPEQIGVLVSPNTSNEELFLLQKMFRAIGCQNIDHRLRQLDFRDQELAPAYPNLGIDFRSLIEMDNVLLLGCNIAKEQPLGSIRLRKMVKSGGKVCSISTIDYAYNFKTAYKTVKPIGEFLSSIAAVLKAVIQIGKHKVSAQITKALNDVVIDDDATDMAKLLISGAKKQIILGHMAVMHPEASQIWAMSNLLASLIGGNCGYFSDGANAAGAWLMGCVPHRNINNTPVANAGLNALDMLQQPLTAYVLYGIEPEFDSILGAKALHNLRQAEFVLAFNQFQSDSLLDIANVIVPIAAPGEFSGTMTNLNGTIQSFNDAIEPFGESRPGWKILRVIGNMLGLEGFDFQNVQEIQKQINSLLVMEHALPKWQTQTILPVVKNSNKDLIHMAPISLYAVDGITRRSNALQATKDAHNAAKICINSKMAEHLNVMDKEFVQVTNANNSAPISLQVEVSDKIANFTAVIYQANPYTLELGAPFTKLEVRKC